MGFLTFWRDLISQWRYVGLIVLASFLLTFYWYQGYHFYFKKRYRRRYSSHPYFEWMAHGWQFGAAWVLLIFVPVIYIKLFLWRPLSDFGVCRGRWAIGLLYVIIACAVLTPGIISNARNRRFYREYPLVRELYGRNRRHMVAWELTYLMYYIPFEFFFRGFIQMGMQPAVGVSLAICFQLLPSVLIHLNKPEEETLAAIGGAFLMGLCIALTGSLVWPILMHWYIGGLTDYYCWRNWQREKQLDTGSTPPVMIP